ncbi:MAG: enediyne biosynthesis protein UnbU [Isosphaeraceae bacterium]
MPPCNGSPGPPGPPNRLPALRRFAVAITILNVLGHFVLGFEQSWAQPLVALATAYSVELILEGVSAWAERRTPQFRGGWCALLDFLLPAHITALAVSMLLYANDRLWPIAFAAALGVASKTLIRVPVGRGVRHCLNPSNTGIAFTLLLFPWIGIAPPYQFTENLSGVGDWLLPTIIVVSGTFLNTRFTGRIPLILGWLGGFVLQAGLRSQLQDTPFVAALLPVTGMAFLLFTFYMVTDPATTPSLPRRQFAFGGAVAAVYGLLMLMHVVFGLFFSLLVVCSLRGLGLAVLAYVRSPARSQAERPMPSRVAIAPSAVLEVAE